MKVQLKSNKSKNIFLSFFIGLSFLLSGTAYIIHTYRLLAFLDSQRVNLMVTCYFYLLQALGIGLYYFLFSRLAKDLVEGKFAFHLSFLIMGTMLVSLFSDNVNLIMIMGGFLNVFIGLLAGYYLAILSIHVEQNKRGLVFGFGYALGSIGTWLMSLPMDGNLLWSSKSIYPLSLVFIIFALALKYIPSDESNFSPDKTEDYKANRKTIFLSLILVFFLLFNNTLGFSFPLKTAIGSVYIEFTRAFYAIGLIMAGLISDKNRQWGGIASLAALAFPLIATSLGDNLAYESTMWILAYFFLGFLTVFKVTLFADLSSALNKPSIAAFGLMAGRIGEALGTHVSLSLTDIFLLIFAAITFVLTVIVFFAVYENIFLGQLSLRDKYEGQIKSYMEGHSFSLREEEVFRLSMEKLSNSEIAERLFISESTVKFHIGNILKKTGTSRRSELIRDFNKNKKSF